MTPSDRDLAWEGCFNVRDLGGLRACGGSVVRRGAVVRSDSVQRLSARGWRAALDHGIRTVIDLRNDDERGPDLAPRPREITTVNLPLDGVEDRAFWDEWSRGWQFGTPRYYLPHLRRFSERHAAVIRAVANAAPGGVVVHCGIGRDRTGLVTLVLLALVGVDAATIADDHALSSERLPPLFALLGQPDQAEHIERHLTEQGTTARAVLEQTVAELESEAYLLSAGVAAEELAAVRGRMLASAG